ncbi:tRNA1Val (adenine37-N6)-methyltransferase [Malonomonas rubra DSM 5091]|uniref:tRNA1Val (Adenine37-N6)-methyltransferase n=1 Tax=Malonomonas rubra DSM 5091 TaxID=1122189 RepID=A0A1M6E897_MALRU|nr:tRNA1(Val) (adenine(37)-N6)-methyltransferase [Malonomonas rubra]SHI81643.1 tRNA1Val (adenine37-N6)-methyltransferase [Malonomonas rubra DSM 5091]
MQRENETIDELLLGNLRLLQAEKGYRFSIDSILLSRFVKTCADDSVVDLGTGCGIVPLLLAKLGSARQLVGIELQSQMAGRAERNVVLNGLQQRVRIINGDLRNVRDLLPDSCADLVVSNPPYRPVGSGRIAPEDERAAARHELAGGLENFLAAARWLLKNGGRFAVIYLAERLPELLQQMKGAGIEPKRLRMVHPRQGEAARMVLVEGRMAGRPGLLVEPPLYIYQGEGRDYTAEVLAFYKDDPDD